MGTVAAPWGQRPPLRTVAAPWGQWQPLGDSGHPSRTVATPRGQWPPLGDSDHPSGTAATPWGQWQPLEDSGRLSGQCWALQTGREPSCFLSCLQAARVSVPTCQDPRTQAGGLTCVPSRVRPTQLLSHRSRARLCPWGSMCWDSRRACVPDWAAGQTECAGRPGPPSLPELPAACSPYPSPLLALTLEMSCCRPFSAPLRCTYVTLCKSLFQVCAQDCVSQEPEATP